MITIFRSHLLWNNLSCRMKIILRNSTASTTSRSLGCSSCLHQWRSSMILSMHSKWTDDWVRHHRPIHRIIARSSLLHTCRWVACNSVKHHFIYVLDSVWTLSQAWTTLSSRTSTTNRTCKREQSMRSISSRTTFLWWASHSSPNLACSFVYLIDKSVLEFSVTPYNNQSVISWSRKEIIRTD